MPLNSITSRIGHMLKFAIFFAIRGGVILGVFTLIFGGIAAFIGISASNGGGLPIAASFIFALPIAVVGTALGSTFAHIFIENSLWIVTPKKMKTGAIRQ